MHKKTIAFIVLLGISAVALARNEAPVVDLSKSSASDSVYSQNLEIDQEGMPQASNNHQNEPIDQRVLRLERQISNLTEMNYASKLEKMQQELQQLHGQLEVQNHDMNHLKEQVKNFYQDLDQRVSKVKPEAAPPEKISSADDKNSKEPSSDTTSNSASSNTAKELQTYESAFNLLNKKDYEKAISGFQAFVKDYPNSTYTANAHYWLGEIYYLKGKPESASKEFQVIVTDYPDHAKVADATLKIALIAMDAGNYTKAKQNFTKVQKQFPGTTAAKIATLRLKELKQKK